MRLRSPILTTVRTLWWPWRALIGAAAVAIGAPLEIHPLASLDALTLYLAGCFVMAGAIEWTRGATSWTRRVIVACWVLAAVVVAVEPATAISHLPIVIATLLVAAGVWTALGARAGGRDARVASAFLGLAAVVLGAVALQWDDLTLVIVAGLFGVYLVCSGTVLVGEALLHRDRPQDEATMEGRPAGLVRRWVRVIAAVLARAVAITVFALGDVAKMGSPKLDAFYDPPAQIPPAPGYLLRYEPYAVEVPAGSHGWRILYTTTDELGRPAIASGIVVVPDAPAASYPVIAWAHGTTGYADQCAPSALKKPFTAGAFPAVFDQVVARKWAVVATDYTGLGTAGPEPYVIGKGEAYSVLDAVRAARRIVDAHLSYAKTVVWGHSQGGGAALWTDEVQPRYARDVPLSGTIAMAPAADPLSLARDLTKIPGGTVFGSFVAMAYAATYPDLKLANFVRPAAIPIVKQVAQRCLAEPGVLASLLVALALKDEPLLTADALSGALGEKLRENIPTDPGPGPLYVVQGTADSIIDPAVVRAYVAELRASGHQVVYKSYPGLNHMPLVHKGSGLLPDLIAWTAQMFAGRS